MTPSTAEGLPPLDLPPGIHSRMIPDVNGLDMHVLEAGAPEAGRPCLLLLHGFPELAYSWRQVMPALAAAGYHVIAPDQRGFGRTTGWDRRYDGDVASFGALNLVTDALALLGRLGIRSVASVIGHDFGSYVAGHGALIRPDVFRSLVMMSLPFTGPPALPFGIDAAPMPAFGAADLDLALGALERPRKHYTRYYSGREADRDMRHCPQGISDFLRAYFHVKSGDFAANAPAPLPDRSARSFALLPTYYVMERDRDMAATVAPDMPSADEIAACAWLPDADLAVYAAEFARNGFQGGLQWYRCVTDARLAADLRVFAGRTIDVPSAFYGGSRDWGVHQTPGAFDAMRTRACTRMIDCRIVDGAGHWVQQERAGEIAAALLEFLRAAG